MSSDDEDLATYGTPLDPIEEGMVVITLEICNTVTTF